MNDITRIQLHGNNKGFLDVDQNTAFPLNFGIAEIRDLSKRKGTFSKSVTLIGNKNNHKLLNHYFDINIEAGSFNINKLQYCDVIQNGIIILENMLLQLVSINKEQQANGHDEKVSYTVIIKDSIGDLFSTINNRLLTDINFSYLDHTFEASGVTASFSNTVENGYKYVMGFNPNSVDDAQFALNEFMPAIYAKQYFDRIFAGAGYSYSWPTLSNDDIRFDKLVIPYNGEAQPTTIEIPEGYKFKAERISIVDTITNTRFDRLDSFSNGNAQFHDNICEYTPVDLSIPTEISDPSNLYNPSTSVYTPPIVPNVTTNVTYKYTLQYEIFIDNNELVSTQMKGYVPDGSGSFPDAALQYQFELQPKIVGKKGVIVDMDNASLFTNGGVYVPNNFNYSPGTTLLGSSVAENTITVYDTNQDGVSLAAGLLVNLAQAGFNYNFYHLDGGDWVVSDVDIRVVFKDMTIEAVTELTNVYGYTLPVRMNNFIPKEIKQSDFLRSIFSMYNLYAELDKDAPKKINIIPRDKYYDAGQEVDWTKKLCKDKTQEVKFLPELQNRKYLLTYKAEDKDGPNSVYTDATSKIYGQQEYTFNNEYVRDTTKVELIFGPSPMFNTTFGAVTPMINGNAPQTQPRILLDGGELSCGLYKIFNSENQYVTSSSYPHLSHWDKPVAPSFDINFGACDYYFRSDDYGAAPVNNLFNLHWRRTLNQINSGRMLTAYFNLNEADIQSLALNHKIRIDNSWWNINSVKDYDANSNAPTKVELITADDGLNIRFRPADTRHIDRTDKAFLAVNNLATKRALYNNTILTNESVLVHGVRNFIGPNVKNAIVLGNDLVVNASNTLFVENIVVPSGGTINGQSITTFSIPEAPLDGLPYVRQDGEWVALSIDPADTYEIKNILFVKNSSEQDYVLTGTGVNYHVIFNPYISDTSDFYTLIWNFPSTPTDKQKVKFEILHDIPDSQYYAESVGLFNWPYPFTEGLFFEYTYYASKSAWYKTS